MADTPRRKRVRERAAAYGRIEVPASDLKNDWHHWLDEVAQGRRTVVVTRYGTPVARLVPYGEPDPEPSVFGALRGRVRAHGDLVAPMGDAWDAGS